MKTQNLTLSLALATIFSSSVAMAETEITGKITHETSAYTQSGIGVGAAEKHSQTTDSHNKDVFKAATHARIFIDGEIDELYEGATFHAEINGFYDAKAKNNDYATNENDTQRDLLREAYIDAEVEGISIRAGKQQVVWGTADGMKLLDAINPTDYTEMAQNQMEDSRIPVWMINAEAEVPGYGGDFQVVVSQAKSSVFAGLGKKSQASASSHSNINGDVGEPFKMKGVDTITGRVHGFLNIAPALGIVAKQIFSGEHRTGTDTGFLENAYGGQGLTVWDYSNGNTSGTFGIKTGAALCAAANMTNSKLTNLCSDAELNISNPDATFEYMSATTFATFDTLGEISSEYRVETNDQPNVSLRFKDSTSNGVNYSLNFLSGFDTNPSVDMHWEDGAGAKLYAGTTSSASTGTDGSSDLGSSDANLTVRLYTTQAKADAAVTDTAYNKIDSGSDPLLVMVESNNEIQQLGGSFDTAIETAALGPVVIRGEALYQHDVESPVIDRKKLGHGDLVGGLSMVKGDMFKYVLGADITVLTNMMISAQFIQEANLDYIDQSQTGHSEYGANLGRYTGDRATLHLTNGLQKAKEFKEFYSLFFSKPFGASGEHRWNNIFMGEDGGGYWNRLDAELSIDDNTQVTVEWNEYFGDENTQFGQLSKSSNVTAGFKYSF